MRKEGASPAEIDAAVIEMDKLLVLYKNPVVRFAMTLMEILPVGIVISFLAAGILRKPEVLPA
jgi:hypothetical protein